VHILKQMITVQTRYTTLFKPRFGTALPPKFGFTTKMQYEFPLRSILATCPDHLHFLDLIIVIMLGSVEIVKIPIIDFYPA